MVSVARDVGVLTFLICLNFSVQTVWIRTNNVLCIQLICCANEKENNKNESLFQHLTAISDFSLYGYSWVFFSSLRFSSPLFFSFLFFLPVIKKPLAKCQNYSTVIGTHTTTNAVTISLYPFVAWCLCVCCVRCVVLVVACSAVIWHTSIRQKRNSKRITTTIHSEQICRIEYTTHIYCIHVEMGFASFTVLLFWNFFFFPCFCVFSFGCRLLQKCVI